MESDPEQAYRRAMSVFPTGVAVVVTQEAEGALIGMTVNSLTSASLSPRMLLWCLGDKCMYRDVFEQAEIWGVTVLGAAQEALALRFARARSQRVTAEESEMLGEAPVLRGGLAHLACRTHHRHRAGDHLIMVGEVLDARVAPGAALTFFRGGYTAVGGSEI
jgi:flavin reductase (DIM6/NTAB) family NADH-FMN oxidoreductase RutF